MSDDPELSGFMLGIVDGIWAETVPGATRAEDLPVLAGQRVDDVVPAVRMGKVSL